MCERVFLSRLEPGLGVRACEAPGRQNGVAPHRVDAAQAAGDLQATGALPPFPFVSFSRIVCGGSVSRLRLLSHRPKWIRE